MIGAASGDFGAERTTRLAASRTSPAGARERRVFDYDDSRLDDDEAGYRFGAHTFVPGEYVTVSDQGSSHTFRVVAVENVTG